MSGGGGGGGTCRVLHGRENLRSSIIVGEEYEDGEAILIGGELL